MQLRIDGEVKNFIPIKHFRDALTIPRAFGVNMFDKRECSGLGRIDQVGPELDVVRQALLDAIPGEMPLQDWLDYLPHLTALFENKLHEISPEVNLRASDIENAVSNFEDVCQKLIYATIQAQAAGRPLPRFQSIYEGWLSASTRVTGPAHSYIHRGAVWAVQIVRTAYGNFGLIVWTDTETYYVHDHDICCPAEGFIHTLMSDVASRILNSARLGLARTA